jgi:hypothetical protein
MSVWIRPVVDLAIRISALLCCAVLIESECEGKLAHDKYDIYSGPRVNQSESSILSTTSLKHDRPSPSSFNPGSLSSTLRKHYVGVSAELHPASILAYSFLVQGYILLATNNFNALNSTQPNELLLLLCSARVPSH